MAKLVRVPPEQLAPATLQALLEEFVSRDGTDYSAEEVPLDVRARQLRASLVGEEVALVYDLDSEQWDFVARERFACLDLDGTGEDDG